MIDLDDYTQNVKDVARLEFGPMSGSKIKEDAEYFYEANPDLLAAHVEAARILNDHGVKVSARFLTELARHMQDSGTMIRVMLCYAWLFVNRTDPDFKIKNSTSPWLTRHLEDLGFQVTKAQSKLDGAI